MKNITLTEEEKTLLPPQTSPSSSFVSALQTPYIDLKTNKKTRDESVDALKGFGILTVIAGHCAFPLTLWINPYSFHMPLFFMIAGFFLNFRISHSEFIKTKFQRLMIPFF